jgi:calcium-dependent protein kinase
MISKNAKDLILHMLCPANKRYNAKQVLKHVWVNNKAPDSKGELKINIDSLLTFQNSNKLRKVVLTFIASRLRDEEVKNIKNIFSRMDKDKKGTLTLQELKTGLEESLSPEDNINIEKLFESIDTDHSGRIDYTEFIAATMDQKLYLKEEKLYEAFNAFDHDSTGKISIEDIKKFLNLQDNSENDDMIQHWIKENDSNGDGVVDFNEFKKMMTK